MENYYILLLLSFIIFITGIYVYFKKKLRAEVNLKEVWKLFWTIQILKVFDVLTTIGFTSKLGIEYEINPIARFFMLQFGIITGLIMMSVLLMPFTFFWLVLANYITENNKIGTSILWKIYKGIIIGVFIITIIINLSAFL